VLAGDGFNAVAAAIKGSGSTETAKMVAYLKTQLKDLPGLTGNISFDDKGDRVGDLYRVYRVDASGKFVLQP
jgi:branched-chain amino acid transport system substrate-binding protein